MRLSGWQRLWVVLAVLWLVMSGAGLWKAHQRTDTVFLDPNTGRETPQDGFLRGQPEGPLVVVVAGNERQYIFPPGTDPKKAAGIVRQYRNAQTKSLLALWLIPPVVLYVLGWSVGWVYLGFRDNRNKGT